MKTSLNSFKRDLLDGILGLLWRQWSLLGVPGHTADQLRPSADPAIIDPEALLLATSELGRFDARLFDESLNWLRQYGKLINIQRLKGILHGHSFGNRQVLAGIAATISENARLSKWRAIEALAKPAAENRALFREINGTSAPVFGKPDPHFQKFGYWRGVASARADATPPGVQKYPDLLLIKLRALLGVNARAEIIAALLSLKKAHPSALARRIAYLPRSVQDVLNEMALSGHVRSERPKGMREKYFSLRPGDWTFLLTWNAPEPDSEPSFPRWIDWSVFFSLVQDTVTILYSDELKSASPLMAALRLHEVYERHSPNFTDAGLSGNFVKSSHQSGLEFLANFLTELQAV